MIEALATGARALVVLASAHLIGTCLFLLRAGPAEPSGLRHWNRALVLSLPFAATILLLSLAVSLVAQAAQITGDIDAALSFAMLRTLAVDTWYGQLWLARVALAGTVLLLALIAATISIGLRPLKLAILMTAMTIAAAAPLSGHASGTENAALLVPLHIVHILALSAWLGGLPAWIALSSHAALAADEASARYAVNAMHGFSILAMICVSLIVLSGVALGWEFIDTEGELLGTRYGLLLCGKLLLLAAVLFIANRLRRFLLPQLERNAEAGGFRTGVRHVRIELLLGGCVLALGAALAQTTPAVHDQAVWMLPFRLSFEATWIEPVSRRAIVLGAGLCVLALGLAFRVSRSGSALGFGMLLATAGAATATWGLSVPAYPDTFRRSPVPYLSVSIAQGLATFETYCTNCHGGGGLGDGALARALPKPPANLSEPHTALHTAGDMYWWFSNGIPDSQMPGFAEVLDEEQRWDLVNFLSAFSQGFEGRVLQAQVLPEQPWLGAPNFYFESEDGTRAELKDFRRLKPVLVAFEDAQEPRSSRRIGELRAALTHSGAAILVEPSSADVWQAYQLLTRTLADRGRDDSLGMSRRHAEFLIDRFGYVRTRWIPSDEVAGWDRPPDLTAQLGLLKREPEILPPPDLHLH
ncbi:MAG: CopD family protein [Panacagrimonas sp.]